MANPTTLPGDLIVPGNARIGGIVSPGLARSSILAQADLQPFNIPWSLWRTFDATGTPIPSAAATDDLGLVPGTHGTTHTSIQAGDIGAATSTRYARALIPLPWEYVAAQSVTLRFYAGMLTAVCDDHCTLDIAVYHTDGDTTLHADGNIAPAPSPNNMNSLSFVNVDFALSNTTNLSPGTELDVLLEIDYQDAATAISIPVIGKCQLLCDVR